MTSRGEIVVADTRRVMVYLSRQLLSEVDEICHQERLNRSQIVREAMQMYIMERHRRMLRQQLKEGYQSMAELNLMLAEEYGCDELFDYESQWAEAD